MNVENSEQMIVENNFNKLNQMKGNDSFAMINNPLNFHNQMNSFAGFDLTNSFMQNSFSSDNQSSPSTPLHLNMMFNQNQNSPNSPNLNSLNNNNNNMRISPSQFNQIQQNNNHLINNSNKTLINRYNNESDEEDFINWENLL